MRCSTINHYKPTILGYTQFMETHIYIYFVYISTCIQCLLTCKVQAIGFLPWKSSQQTTPVSHSRDWCSAGSLCHRDRLPISSNHRRVLPRSHRFRMLTPWCVWKMFFPLMCLAFWSLFIPFCIWHIFFGPYFCGGYLKRKCGAFHGKYMEGTWCWGNQQIQVFPPQLYCFSG